MALATNIGSSTGSPLPLTKAAEHIYAAVVQHHEDLAKKDFSCVYLYLKRAAQEDKEITIR